MAPATITSIARSAPARASRGGEPVFFRPVHSGDATRMLAFLRGLSLRTVQQRFWSGGPNLARLAGAFAAVDPDRVGMVACDPSGAIVAHAEYAVLRPGVAEVAVVVADRAQGRGLGSRLVAQLTSVAADAGIGRLVATVHPDNAGMLHVFTEHFGATVRHLGDECRIAFQVDAGGAALLVA